MKGLTISTLSQIEIEFVYQVFEITIPDAFQKEGLDYLKNDIQSEIEHKKHLLKEAEVSFLIAKVDNKVIGTISFGPCGQDIKKCTKNMLADIGELGSLYVLPQYQGKGVGSALIYAMVEHLYKIGVDKFCLDSGYKCAQKRWLRKFGEPYKIEKSYWGPDNDHMIWLCKVADFKK